jgi:predicted phosphodiesterase
VLGERPAGESKWNFTHRVSHFKKIKQMTIIAIGDIHGREEWKQIVQQEPDADKLVFIGDYFDTFAPISPKAQHDNFLQILALKKQKPKQVVLLLGNHDYHYLSVAGETYSGYQPVLKMLVEADLKAAIDEQLLQVCLAHQQWLFSHAGISRTWCKQHQIDERLPAPQFQDSVNHLLLAKPQAFAFTMGPNHSPYGDDLCQGPLWIRPNSLRKDAIADYAQVVGHTQQAQLSISPLLTLIDTLGTEGTYLRITHNKMDAVSVA